MGNSTVSLQSVVDYVNTIGDLMTQMPVGGFTNSLAQSIANDVMSEFLAQRFNWKFNRIIIPPFPTISWQQDYATINLKTLGWLEHGVAVDINNTALPKPIFWLTVKRDLELTSNAFGQPNKVCWLPNDQLTQGVWPGAQQTYTQPIGATQTPSNPKTVILDANGNILVLTTFGITGNVAPAAPAQSAAGVTVNDGTCIWTVADPKAQGFRLSPLPPQSGVVYQIYLIGQAKPTRFTSMEQMIDPIPDDYEKAFKDGFIALAHRHSTAPVVRARAETMRKQWLESLQEAKGQGDREEDDAMFVPTRTVIDSYGYSQQPSAMWPYPLV